MTIKDNPIDTSIDEDKKTIQQEKLDELLRFLRYRLVVGDYTKAKKLLEETLHYLKSDVLCAVKKMILDDLDEKGKELFNEIVGEL